MPAFFSFRWKQRGWEGRLFFLVIKRKVSSTFSCKLKDKIPSAWAQWVFSHGKGASKASFPYFSAICQPSVLLFLTIWICLMLCSSQWWFIPVPAFHEEDTRPEMEWKWMNGEMKLSNNKSTRWVERVNKYKWTFIYLTLLLSRSIVHFQIELRCKAGSPRWEWRAAESLLYFIYTSG